MRLDGKMALITREGAGGSSTAVAERFVKDGAKVCVAGAGRRKRLKRWRNHFLPGRSRPVRVM